MSCENLKIHFLTLLFVLSFGRVVLGDVNVKWGRVSGKIIFVFIEIGQLEDTEVEVDEWPLLNLFSFLSQI